jgi:hypothetical protein
MRCGDKTQHNYLVTVFRVTNEKRERLIVCAKCKDIFSKEQKETKKEDKKEDKQEVRKEDKA